MTRTRLLAAGAALLAAVAMVFITPAAEAQHFGHHGFWHARYGYPFAYPVWYAPPPVYPVYVEPAVAYVPPPIVYRYGYRHRVHHYVRRVVHHPCSCYCCR